MNKRAWGFALALALQILILLGVPAQKVWTRATGRTVVLKVAPVDPYSLLSGYYVTLGYEIGRREAFPNHGELGYNGSVYAIVEQQADGVWHPVALAATLPHQIALRGRATYGRIEYGIEEFYIPENQRAAIADDLRAHPDAARVEVKVDARGNVALVRLRIEGRAYED
jgi:uncharacterized membrane-anchored protein